MAMMQPPSEAQLATKQDVETAAGKVESRVERVERRLERMDEKLDRLIERLGGFLTKDDFHQYMQHYASKEDVERMGRVLTFWMVGSVSTLIAGMLVGMWRLTDTLASLAR